MTHRNKVATRLFSSIEAPKQIISLIHLKHLMKILTKTSKRDSWFCKYDVLPLLQWILREAKWRVVPWPCTWSHKDHHHHQYKHHHHHHPIQTIYHHRDNIKLPTSELATSSQSWGWQFWVYPLLRIANPSYHSLSSLTGDI